LQVKGLIEILEGYDPELKVMAACEGYGNIKNIKRSDIRIVENSELFGDTLHAVLSIVTDRS
jgi:isopentenyl diphosphate isomerase/L-lactate dehydrogenase-like FMN-dependent dehydrogenase